MKKAVLIIILAVLSALSGYLMSKVSLVGRTGMSFFYRSYNFLKVWWQGALAVWVTLMVLLLIQGTLHSKLKSTTASLLELLLLLLAFAGLYFTFSDFRHTLSHRWLGERFHLGAYLFWLGWIIVCLYYLFQKKKKDANLYSK